ncbi:hypothetical protein GCM10010129_40340 [Streptomyces fumigatiscleroticus]|nr:hypothetical protein GCM10010129_40340 [Streptomyces fumigatiscleroticus]
MPDSDPSCNVRFYPPESAMFERCPGLAWCSQCHVCTGTMAHVPRNHVLDDALASLPADERDRLLRKETALIEYLDRRVTGRQ